MVRAFAFFQVYRRNIALPTLHWFLESLHVPFLIGLRAGLRTKF